MVNKMFCDSAIDGVEFAICHDLFSYSFGLSVSYPVFAVLASRIFLPAVSHKEKDLVPEIFTSLEHVLIS